MNYSRIVTNGSARDEELKRRNSVVRDSLGMGPKPETVKPAEPKSDDKPSKQLDSGQGSA